MRGLVTIPTLIMGAAVCLGLGCSSSCSSNEPPPDCPPAAGDHSNLSADLEPFLRSYFATWSRGDMEGYRSHFHRDATIYLVKNGKVIMSMRRDPFVDVQKSARESSEDPGVEVMTKFTANEDRYAASVDADWELTHDDEVAVGVDRFTLIRDEQWNWKIISLTYYVTGRSRAKRDRAKAEK